MNINTNNPWFKILIFFGIILDLLFLFWILGVLGIWDANFALLSPKGVIAAGQKHVLLTSVLLMFVLAVPFYIATFLIIHRYKVDNNNDTLYQPDLSGTTFKQMLLWVLPAALVFCLSVIIWKSSHALDPFKEIRSDSKPITIQVVALDWKWLFIYPEHNIATVNFVEFPENTPINFVLTADAPMNSFWIPELGGQMYAMAGMSTKLNLMAGQQGEFRGSAAEINGDGFSGMNFIAKSVSGSEYEQWINSVKQSNLILSSEEYSKLANPSKNNSVVYYSSADTSLYNNILSKYMNAGDSLEMDQMPVEHMYQH
jgi:cytochrome o ubiquinol oxidase subunit II